MAEPWDRRDDESPEAFFNFVIYRDLGPKRSLAKLFTSELGGYEGGTRGVSSRIEKWSSDYAWVTRSNAWDAHLQVERDKVVARQARKWERRRLKALDANWKASLRLFAKFEKMMAFPISSQETSKDGKTIIVEPARWTFQSAAMIAKIAAEIQAATLMAVTKDVDDMSDAEVRGTIDGSLDEEDEAD